MKAQIEMACQWGIRNTEVRGTAWLRTVDKNGKTAQFPATIFSTPQKVQIEPNDLAGNSHGRFIMDGTKYMAHDSAGKKLLSGHKEWNGIPVQWARVLALGQFPCPHLDSLKSEDFSQDSEFVKFQLVDQQFQIQLQAWAGKPWIAKLQVHDRKANARFQFDFEKPHDLFGTPTKWNFEGPKGQSIQFRWRDLDIQTRPSETNSY